MFSYRNSRVLRSRTESRRYETHNRNHIARGSDILTESIRAKLITLTPGQFKNSRLFAG
jgi:hypothetical protein